MNAFVWVKGRISKRFEYTDWILNGKQWSKQLNVK